MCGAEDLVFVEMKVDTLTDYMVVGIADKAFQVELFVQGFKYLPIDCLAALGTGSREKGFVVFLAVRPVLVFPELISWKRFAAFRADKVFRVPVLIQCTDVLPFNNFPTVCTFWVE